MRKEGHSKDGEGRERRDPGGRGRTCEIGRKDQITRETIAERITRRDKKGGRRKGKKKPT